MVCMGLRFIMGGSELHLTGDSRGGVRHQRIVHGLNQARVAQGGGGGIKRQLREHRQAKMRGLLGDAGLAENLDLLAAVRAEGLSLIHI